MIRPDAKIYVVETGDIGLPPAAVLADTASILPCLEKWRRMPGDRLRQPVELVQADPSSPERVLAAFFDSLDIPHLWPSRALHDEERQSGQLVRFPRDRHLTPHGHEVLAGMLEPFLRARRLVP